MSQTRLFDLDLLRLSLRRALYEMNCPTTAETVRVHDVAEELALDVSAFVAAEVLPPETVTRRQEVRFRVPAGWFDTFRDEHLGNPVVAWTVRRWPIRWKTLRKTVELTVDLRRYWTFPHAPVPIEMVGERYRVAKWNVEVGVEE